MKRNLFMKGAIALLSFLASCTSAVDEVVSPTDDEIMNVIVNLSDSDISVNSRMNIAVSNTVKYYWENTDTIGIFPNDGYQVAFPLKTTGESSSATFTGGGWALKSGSTYAAYYPFEYNNRRSDSIPVSYLGQKQIGNKKSELADKYNYMSAVGNKPSEGSLSFDMKRLGRFIILKFNVAEPTTLTSVKLTASEAVFTTKGYFNLWASPHSIIPTETSNSLTIDLENLTTTEANEEVTVYFFMPPVNLSGETLTLEVTNENGGKLLYSVPGKDMTASKAYALSATIKESPVGNGTYQNGVVSIAEAGTMKKLLGDDYLNITSLKVVGPINGDDVYYLRKMLGGHDFSEADWGKLTTLDLSKVTIVEGGEWYYNQTSWPYEHYTSNDTIGDYMFYACANLQNIVLPKNITSIGKYALTSSQISSIEIPCSVTSIEDYAFDYCESLTSVYITDLLAWFKVSIDYRSSPLYNGATLYVNGEELKDLVIPNEITKIWGYRFEGCKSIVKVTIHDNVTWIGPNAFRNCPALSSVTIGSGVTKIESNAFEDCDALTEVYCYATTPPEFPVYDSHAPFNNYDEKTILYVPSRCGSKYKSSQWGFHFKTIKEMD